MKYYVNMAKKKHFSIKHKSENNSNDNNNKVVQ